MNVQEPAGRGENQPTNVQASAPLPPADSRLLRWAERLIFGPGTLLLVGFVLLTLGLGWAASGIRADAGFDKQLPLNHPYIQTFLEYQDDFGGANKIAVALYTDEASIYSQDYMEQLDAATSAVFLLPGIDRSTVRSLFTPGVRYSEITDEGFESGDVVPRDEALSPALLDTIAANVRKSGLIGSLVSSDQRGAMITAQLLDEDPATGERLDYAQISAELEALRARFEQGPYSVHIIGFAPFVGAVMEAAGEVRLFFGIALLLTGVLLWLYCGSIKLAALPLLCAVLAVIWEFGLLRLLGFGLDPLAVLVPFLVLAIGVSHGIQMVNAWVREAANGHSSVNAAKLTFRQLAIPGTVALITDVIGFATIYLIDIAIIREMALNAALGMAAIIVSNKILMPVLLARLKMGDPQRFAERQARRTAALDPLWRLLSGAIRKPVAVVTILVSLLLLAWSIHAYQKLEIGDLQAGVPELRPNARYNVDARTIVDGFATGIDQMKIIVETAPEACVRHTELAEIDRLTWHLRNTDGVAAAVSLPSIARRVVQGMNEGNMRWQALPRNQFVLASATRAVPSSAGLSNPDCSVFTILVYSVDHRADTIDGIVQTVEQFQPETDAINVRLASGNLGVMAATNAVIAEKEKEIVLWVYAVLIVFIFVFLRSKAAVACAVLPLALTSMLTYAFMGEAGIGLKVATLPIVALGVGIGVDDSLYLLSVLRARLAGGDSLVQGWFHTLRQTGRAVVFTSVALAASVATWLLSGLQFQADMGLLLVFMFVVNLIGAVLILPAIAAFLIRPGSALTRATTAGARSGLQVQAQSPD